MLTKRKTVWARKEEHYIQFYSKKCSCRTSSEDGKYVYAGSEQYLDKMSFTHSSTSQSDECVTV
jgi:hypothetical protein